MLRLSCGCPHSFHSAGLQPLRWPRAGPVWLFRAQCVSTRLSGWLGGCSRRGLPRSGWQCSVVGPRESYKELSRSRSGNPTKPGLLCSSPGAALALACRAGRTDVRVQLSSFNCPSGQAGPDPPKRAERWRAAWRRADKDSHSLRRPAPGRTWMGHVSDGKGSKVRESSQSQAWFFPLCWWKL